MNVSISFLGLTLCLALSSPYLAAQILEAVQFSHESGWYDNEFELSVTDQEEVFYNMNGSYPDEQSTQYTAPIQLREHWANSLSEIPTSHIFIGDEFPSNEFGFRTPEYEVPKCNVILANRNAGYGFSEQPTPGVFWINKKRHYTPVISIITDSLSLFDRDTGIYIPGSSFDHSNPEWTGNYFNRGDQWERTAYLLYFDQNGDLQHQTKAGIRVSGNATRRFPQKSLKLYFRSEYGNSKIPNLFFPERDNENYKRLVLKSSFSYWYLSKGRNTMFQDDLIHRLAFEEGADLDVALSLPVSVYLNSEYWGILNLRESHDKFFLESVYGLDRDSVSIVDGVTLEPESGTAESYIQLLEFAQSNDLSLQSNFEVVENSIDVVNYIDYFIFQTYFGNADWPFHNVLVWKPDIIGAKWRWHFYDLDAAMNSVHQDPFEFMDLQYIHQSDLFNSMVKNHGFKERFLNRYLHFLNDAFRPERIKELANVFISSYENEIANHAARWGNPISREVWFDKCRTLYEYAEKRPCYIKLFLEFRFDSNLLDSFNCGYPANNIDFNMYPNPSSEFVDLEFENYSMMNGEVAIYNSLGQKLLSNPINKLVQRFNLNDMPNGIYIVKAISQDEVHSKRLIISR